MKNYDESAKIKHNPIWNYIPDYSCRILIIGGSGIRKQPDIDKTYLYVKDPLQSKYQLLINGREKVEIEHLKIQRHSQTIDYVYENLEDYNPTKKIIVLDDMIADMESNKNLSPKVTELFLRGRKLNISLFFISQSYFKVTKTLRLNARLHFKIPNKRELQQIA